MTALRKRMIEDMQLRNFSPQTQRTYLHHIAGLAQFYRTSGSGGSAPIPSVPGRPVPVFRRVPQSVCFRGQISLRRHPGGAFRYGRVVARPGRPPRVHHSQPAGGGVVFPERPQHPQPGRSDGGLWAGLRVSEVVALKVQDIDSQRMVLRVQHGKGGRDRYAMLSPRLLQVLRTWYRAARPMEWLFPGWRGNTHLTPASLQQACRDAAQRAGLRKRITVHSLRHYAASRTMPRGSERSARRPSGYRVACAPAVQHAA